MSEKTVTSQQFFLDRETSLQTLVKVFENVNETAESHFVFVLGQAGIGKTSLVKQFISTVEKEDVITLTAKGYEEQNAPLFSFSEMMKNFLSTYRSITKGDVLDSILNLAKLVPALEPYVSSAQQVVKTINGLSDVDKYSLDNSYYVFSNYLAILQKISRKKTVVFWIDDLQWLDNTSLELLSYLMRKLNQRIMVITSYRTAFITSQKELDRKESLDGLLKISPERSTLIDLDAIPENLYPKFIEGFIGPHKFGKDEVHLLYKQTQGNPFFLRSLLGLFRESKNVILDSNGFWSFNEKVVGDLVPENLFDTLSRRLRRVYSDLPGSREILAYASVMGFRFDLETLSNFMKKDKLEVYHILQDIESIYSIVRSVEGSTTFVFEHRKTQEVIYANLGRLAIDCHSRIAKFLESDSKNSDPFAIAYHYQRAQEWDLALHYMQMSAKVASDNYFFSDAIKQYEECFSLIKEKNTKLSKMEINSLRLGYSKALLGNNSVSACITNLNNLVQTENLLDDQKAEAKLLLGRCHRIEGTGESDTKAIQSLEESLQIYERVGATAKLGEVYSYLATVYDHFGHYEKAVKCFEKSQIHFNMTRDNVGLAKLQRKSGMIYESRRAIEFMKNALNIFEKYSMRIERARCLNNIGAESFYIGSFSEAEQYLGASLEMFRNLDSPEVDISLNNLGLVCQQKKEYVKALQFFEDAHSNVSESFNEIFINMNLANVYRQTGDLEKARQIIVHLEPIVLTYHEPVMNDYYGFNRSVIHYELDEIDQAERWLQKYSPNNYKEDNELVLAKRNKMLAKIYDKKGEDSSQLRQRSQDLFNTARPQKWFYEIDYYPCDIHIWD